MQGAKMVTFTWSDLRGEPRFSGAQLQYEYCPVCGHGGWKFYISEATGGWFCFAGSHNSGGFIAPRCWWPDPRQLQFATAPIEWHDTEVPDPLPLGKKAQEYLLGRGIGPTDARNLGLCESGEYPGRVFVPFFWRGALIYWTARGIHPGVQPRYVSAPGKHPLYVATALCNDDIVVVEGPFDAIRVARAGFTGVALCGMTLPRHLEPMMRDVLNETRSTRVWILLDNTHDALANSVRVSNRLTGLFDGQVSIAILPEQYKDPGETPTYVLMQLLG